MKIRLSAVLVLAMICMLLIPSALLKARDINMVMDGRQLWPSTEQGMPYIKDDRLMVPLRFLSENLAMQVSWDAEQQQITVCNWDNSMAHIFRVGSVDFIKTYAGVQEWLMMDVAPEIVNGRTFLPIRAAEELLGQIDWDAESRTVSIEVSAYNKKPW